MNYRVKDGSEILKEFLENPKKLAEVRKKVIKMLEDEKFRVQRERGRL